MTQTFFIAHAQDANAAVAAGLPCVLLCYRISKSGALQRTALPRLTRGSLLGILASPDLSPAFVPRLQQMLLAECHRRGYVGVWFSAAPADQEPTAFVTLCANLQQKGLSVFLPQAAARSVPGSRVILPGSLSGGTLEDMLADYASRYESSRIALDLQRCRHSFSMPCQAPQGCPLTQEVLEQILHTHHCQTFFSPELCTHYCTYHPQGEAWKFLLFDDADSILRRIRRAFSFGVSCCFLSFREWQAEAKHIAADLLQIKE